MRVNVEHNLETLFILPCSIVHCHCHANAFNVHYLHNIIVHTLFDHAIVHDVRCLIVHCNDVNVHC
jgi:hypothetical protein